MSAAPARPMVSLIAAVARNGVIGGNNRLLWRLPEDQRFLRQRTMGHPVIMGRRTWDSLPERFRPLPGRLNVVVTRQAAWRSGGAITANSVEQALALARESPETRGPVYILGGAELYEAALPFADELVLTEIDQDFEGDIRFPAWDRAAYLEVQREAHHAAPPNDFDFSFVIYRRKGSPGAA